MNLLISGESWPAVSLYMPTERKGIGSQANAIKFKNLIKEADRRLHEARLGGAAVRGLLAPAAALLDDSMFWSHQADGLAVFLADGFLRRYRLPAGVPELVAVQTGFHTKPLMRLFAGDGKHYLLARA